MLKVLFSLLKLDLLETFDNLTNANPGKGYLKIHIQDLGLNHSILDIITFKSYCLLQIIQLFKTTEDFKAISNELSYSACTDRQKIKTWTYCAHNGGHPGVW